MNLIYSVLFITIFNLLFTKVLKKHKNIFIVTAFIIAVCTTYFEILCLKTKITLPGILMSLEKSSIKGIYAISFFILVMFAGALNSKWSVTRKLLTNRATNAIIGSIMLLPHGIIYIIKFLMKILQNFRFTPVYLSINLIGIVAFIIMVPLFITSFNKIRIKMNVAYWNKLQKYAYMFYILSYVHIVLILLSKTRIDYLKLTVYSLIFISYFIFKITKYYKKKATL